MDWGLVNKVISQSDSSIQDKFDVEQKYWNEASDALVGPLKVSEFGSVLSTAFSNLVDINKPSTKLLDFGCGVGRAYKALNPKCKYTGIDMSESYLNHFKLAYAEADLVLINTQEIPFPDEYFHAAICYSVLTHVSLGNQCDKILSELYRVLKLNGVLLISVFLDMKPQGNWVTYDSASWTKQFHAHGFKEHMVSYVPESTPTICQSLYTLIK